MSVVPIDFQDAVNDSNVGVNERIFFSFVCRMTQMNAQKCYVYWMLIKMQKSLLNLIYGQMFTFCANECIFALLVAVSRKWMCIFSYKEQQKVYIK